MVGNIKKLFYANIRAFLCAIILGKVIRGNQGTVHRPCFSESVGGPIAFIKNNDIIRIDIPNRKLNIKGLMEQNKAGMK